LASLKICRAQPALTRAHHKMRSAPWTTCALVMSIAIHDHTDPRRAARDDYLASMPRQRAIPYRDHDLNTAERYGQRA